MKTKQTILSIGILFLLVVSSFASASECVSGSTYINVISKNEFTIGEQIKGITVRLNKDVFNSLSTVTAILKEGDNEIGTRVSNQFVNQLGEANLDFKYNHPRSGDLKIEIIVKDSAGTPYQTSFNIKVLPTLETKVTCDLQGYVNRDVKCEWKVLDKETRALLSGVVPIISVVQGDKDIIYNPTGSSSFTFKTGTSGSVNVKVKSTKTGYIGDENEILVGIQNTQTSDKLFIDGKDFLTYSASGLTTGTKTLEIKAEESGEPVEIQNINAEIFTPSAQKVPLVFNKVSESTYRANYNLVQAGQVYILTYSIIFKDTSKDPIYSEYKISTASSVTEDIKGQTNLFLIGGIVTGVVAFGFIIFLLLRRRR